jgi:DNA processing protein
MSLYLNFRPKCDAVENELLYSVALSRVGGIGPVYAKKLLRFFGEARDVFTAGEGRLTGAGIPPHAIRAILAFQNFSSLEKEMTLLDRKGIRILLFTDPDYPQRLSPIETAPFLLFCKGKIDWNAKKVLAVIGTRDPNEYGRQMTDRLIRDLVASGPVIISGLASGIDGAAHRAALKYGLPTIGVLGHGFGYVYPGQNADLFRAMANRGGLITEFPYDTPPDSYQFPFRNRIVAGMSDAVVVVETNTKGGSLGTIKKGAGLWKKDIRRPGPAYRPKKRRL